MGSTPGFVPRPHWWEASALTATPPLLPVPHPCCVLLGIVAQSLRPVKLVSYVQTDAKTPNVASVCTGLYTLFD